MVCIAVQTPLEATLTEDESRRNSRRMDLMYVSSSNPVTPDIFYLADQNRDLDAQARAQAAQPLNAEITGLLRQQCRLLFTQAVCACLRLLAAAASSTLLWGCCQGAFGAFCSMPTQAPQNINHTSTVSISVLSS